MAIDFSDIGGTPAQTGHIDFSAVGGIPAVGQEAPESDTTALGAFGRGAASTIPLGTQSLAEISSLAEGKPYPTERKEIEEEIKSDVADHRLARIAGQAAGIAAPALLTGGASAPESLAEAAGQGAAVGAGFGAGNAIDTLTSGGSGAQAAKQVALGTGLGVVGGAVGQKLGEVLQSATPSLEEFAAKKAAQASGMGSKELGNMSQEELQDTGRMLLDKGILRQGASTQEMFDTAKNLQEMSGDTIGQAGGEMERQFLTTDPSSAVVALKARAAEAAQFANPDERRMAIWYSKGASDIDAMAQRNLQEHGDYGISFNQLQRLKKSYGNSAFEQGAVKNPAAADIYGTIRDVQQDIVGKVQDNPDLPGQLRDAMTNYSKLHPVVSGLQDVLGRERAGNLPSKGFGMIGKLVGQLPGQSNPTVNALTSLGLLGAGHPLWAVGAATATLQNPRNMANLAQSAANALPRMAGSLPIAGAQVANAPMAQNMGETKPVRQPETPQAGPSAGPGVVEPQNPNLAPWKPVFDKNAATAKSPADTEKANAVTDYVLSQRDPAYAKAKDKAADQRQGKGQPFNTQMSDQLKTTFGGK